MAGAAGNTSIMAFTKAIGSRSMYPGVQVVGVNPGPVETDGFQQFMERRAIAEFDDVSRAPEFYAHWPLERFARPTEVADRIVLLASARASYLSGTFVTIDGGMVNNNAVLRQRAECCPGIGLIQACEPNQAADSLAATERLPRKTSCLSYLPVLI